MGFNSREVESKLVITSGHTIEEINSVLRTAFEEEISQSLLGSSVDTYWSLSPTEFLRMRERDGIRQITYKERDRSALDRVEIDIDSTSDVSTVMRLLSRVNGKPSGRVGKTYYIHWLGGSKYNTICTYQVTEPVDRTELNTYVEIEATSMERMLELETKVVDVLSRQGILSRRASGSLYEIYILPPWVDKEKLRV